MQPTDQSDEAGETAYLGLGANIGEPEKSICRALFELERNRGIIVRQVSSLYRTAPIGVTDQPDYYNAVARIETRLAPEALLSATLYIENQFGRTRTKRWAPRVIDIDILLYGRRSVSAESLTIPHPRMYERAFVLIPLAEIAPDLRVPGGDAAETVLQRAAVLAGGTRIAKLPWSGHWRKP